MEYPTRRDFQKAVRRQAQGNLIEAIYKIIRHSPEQLEEHDAKVDLVVISPIGSIGNGKTEPKLRIFSLDAIYSSSNSGAKVYIKVCNANSRKDERQSHC